MNRDRRIDIHDNSHLGSFGRHIATDDVDKLHDGVFKHLCRFVIDRGFTQNGFGDGFLQVLRNRDQEASLDITGQVHRRQHEVGGDDGCHHAFTGSKLQVEHTGDHLVGKIGRHFPDVVIGGGDRKLDAVRYILGLICLEGIQLLLEFFICQCPDLYQRFADVQMGIGMMVWGLASVIIGEAIINDNSLGFVIIGAVVGSVLFRLLVAIALRWGLNPNDLKIITALFVFIALILPGLMKNKKLTFKRKINA